LNVIELNISTQFTSAQIQLHLLDSRLYKTHTTHTTCNRLTSTFHRLTSTF